MYIHKINYDIDIYDNKAFGNRKTWSLPYPLEWQHIHTIKEKN